MFRFCFVFIALFICLFWTSSSFATCVFQRKMGSDFYNIGGLSKGLLYLCTIDTTNTIADLSDPGVTGQLQVVEVAFSSPAPTSVQPIVKTWNGSTVFTGSVVSSAATGRQKPDVPELLVGGIKVAMTVVGAQGAKYYLILGFLQ